MKKITRTGIPSLMLVLVFMFTIAFAEVTAASRFVPPTDRGYIRTQGMQIQPKHKYQPFLDLNKHELTLAKGKSEKLKAYLTPGGKSVSVRWHSINYNIATVSDFGEVIAVAPGITRIYVYTDNYYGVTDETGPSAVCFVTVTGGKKDAPLLGKNDWMYSYGNTKLTAPTGKYKEALASVKKSIGGIEYYNMDYGLMGLLFGSKDYDKAHTFIYYNAPAEYSEFADTFGFVAEGKSPIKTNRGITIGTKKSEVLQKYGLPTEEGYYTVNDKHFECFVYQSKTSGKNLYTIMIFTFSSKDTVSVIRFTLGAQYYY